jgi:hypothetical protein
MIKIISIPVQFQGREYYALIRVCMKPECTQLKVTIMNGELEKHLNGNHVFEYRNGYLIADICAGNNQTALIQSAVLTALDAYLHEHPLFEDLSLHNQRTHVR